MRLQLVRPLQPTVPASNQPRRPSVAVVHRLRDPLRLEARPTQVELHRTPGQLHPLRTTHRRTEASHLKRKMTICSFTVGLRCHTTQATRQTPPPPPPTSTTLRPRIVTFLVPYRNQIILFYLFQYIGDNSNGTDGYSRYIVCTVFITLLPRIEPPARRGLYCL